MLTEDKEISTLCARLEAVYKTVRTLPESPDRRHGISIMARQVRTVVLAPNLEATETQRARLRRDIDELALVVDQTLGRN